MPVLLALLVGLYIQANAQSDSLVNKWVHDSVSKLEVPKGGVVIGDSLPEAFWDLVLKVTNHPQGLKIIRMADYKDKLLVLDFWNTACVPCYRSVENWVHLRKLYDHEVTVIPVHLYGDNSRVPSFAKSKNWDLQIALGNEADTLINRLFYTYRNFGEVWIKDGKLLAIPRHKMANEQVISHILTNKEINIEMDDNLTYFDKRYRAAASVGQH